MTMTFYVMIYVVISALVTAAARMRGVVRGRLTFFFFLLVLLLSPLPFLLVLILMGPRPTKKAETPP